MSTSPYSLLSGLRCSETGQEYPPDEVANLSPSSATLFAEYDLDRVAESVTREEIGSRAPSLWRYHELLPVRDRKFVRGFDEGMTPLLEVPSLAARVGLRRMLVKEESSLPTGSFKARGAAVGVARAAELGVSRLAMPTNGNAGAAWAAYCARSGIAATVVMPVDAPQITRSEAAFVGADVFLIDGLISDAGRAVGAYVAQTPGVFDASTLKEPYRVEGKKTMGLEIVEQLGWRVPDVIVYPTGGGVGVIGIHKALRELQQLGWIGPQLPRLVCVQAAGCDPFVRAFVTGASQVEAQHDTSSIAFGINVPAPLLGGPSVLRAMYETEGTAISVTDAELLDALRLCANTEGLLMCPEGAATIAAVAQLRESGWLAETDEVVVLNTGAGNKYPDALASDPPILPRDGTIPTVRRD